MGAIVLAAAQVFNICALFVGYCWEFGLPRLGFRRRALLATFRRVFAMLGSTMLMAIYSVVDILVLSYLGSAQAVGLFGAANRIRTLVNTTCVILLTSYTPVLARSAGNTAEMHRHGSDYAKIMYLAVAPIALFLAIFSADAMSFAFGAQFIAAAPALSILMFVLLLAAVNMTHGNPLLVWGRERYFMFSVLMAAGLNAVMNTLLIPRFGVYGAAWADLATEMFLFGRYILHFRRLGLAPHLRLLGLCLFVAAIANGGSYLIVSWLMPDMAAFFRLLAGGCLMLLFYAGLVSVTGVLDLLRLGRALSAKIWPG
jgi:O-antigen/teichoic acid export membrane protein